MLVASWFNGLTTNRRPGPLGFDGEQKAEVVPAPASALEPPTSERPFNGALFPRFHASGSDQTTSNPSDRFACARLRLRNSYTPSQPVIYRRVFAGRVEILTSLIRAIEDQRGRFEFR